MTSHATCAEPFRTHRRLWAACSVLVVVLFLPNSASALDPDRRISQYGHTAWRLQDGFFAGAPLTVAQTTDGYLWIGTASGLIRFDGVRFVPWVFPSNETLLNTIVYSLLGDRDGSLWIGTGGGLSHWKDGHLLNYRQNRGRINALRQDGEGTIWLVRSRPQDDNGPFCRVQGDRIKCHGKAESIDFPWAQELVGDRHGGFWIGATSGLCHWTPEGVSNFFPERLKGFSGQAGVNGLDLTADGSILAGIGQSGSGFGVQRLSANRWSDFPLPETSGPPLRVSTLFIDRDHGIWVSAVDGGLIHASGGRADRFRQSDGLSSDTITNFYEDREGNVWTISPEGIDRFRDLPVGTLSKREGPMPHIVGSVSASRTGSIWIGGGSSPNLLKDGKLSNISRPPVKQVTCLIEDHEGRLWAGTEAGLSVMQNGKVRLLIKDRSGRALNMVSGLTEDTEGNIWALVTGRPQRLLRIRGFDIIEEFVVSDPAVGGALAADPTGGIWIGHVSGALTRYQAGAASVAEAAEGSGTVRNLAVDPDGSTWAATEKGLVRRKDGKRLRLDRRNGLPCDDLFAAIRDDSGALWLYATCGLIRITSTDLEQWWIRPASTVSTTVFDSVDGAHPAMVPFGPVVSKSADGRLWFSNDTAIQFVDPHHLVKNTVAPPVQIEQVVADRVNHPPNEDLRLPAHTRDVRIDYTALSMSAPQKVKFRYKLEGRDDGWEEAGTRRQAFYTDLPPSNYRFRVIACNNDAVWNEAGASLAFSISPAYYQTAWFFCVSVTAGLLALWAIYRLRVRQIAAEMSLRFDERLAERNRLSGELHDTILQSVQMSKMVADHALNDASADTHEGLRNALTTLSGWLSQATTDGRAALNSLRTSSAPTQDLAEAFRQAAEISVVRGDKDLVVSVEGAAREMHPIVRDEVYRIGCEAIRNACLHSGATEVSVKLIFARELTVRVQDNGKGIDATVAAAGRPGHFGLTGMQERALRIGAEFRILSRAGSGTDVELAVPGKIAYARANRGTAFGKLRRLLELSGTDSE